MSSKLGEVSSPCSIVVSPGAQLLESDSLIKFQLQTTWKTSKLHVLLYRSFLVYKVETIIILISQCHFQVILRNGSVMPIYM